MDTCQAGATKWSITPLSLVTPAGGRPPSGRIAYATPEAVEQVPPAPSWTTPPPQPHPDPKAPQVSTHSGGTGEDDNNISDTDESDNAFTHYG